MGRAHEVRAKAMAATAAKKSKLYLIFLLSIYKIELLYILRNML